MKKYKHILITGGAGFVGSNLAFKFRSHYKSVKISVLDNLKRRGSELNLIRLKSADIEFIHGDIRNLEDFNELTAVDLLVEASAEPSVMAGLNGSPEYLINTNLLGAINCFEFARRQGSAVIFLSTSRVYPIKECNDLKFRENRTRFELKTEQKIEGASGKGIAENFPLGNSRSLYGATKLCSEFMMNEYFETYGLRGVINRCGVITGPWQMGKIDQGVIVLWIARHIWANKSLSYIGYGGKGKQVRDFIHVDDLFEAIKIQVENLDKFNGQVYNIGGGVVNSLSLSEMTSLCQKITGNKIKIGSVLEDRPNDIRIYITDSRKFQKASGWECRKDAETTFREIYNWIMANKKDLEPILN